MAHELAYIGIGSNLGDRKALCHRAIESIGDFRGTTVTATSSFYESEPLELPSQNWFINCVIGIKTELLPEELLSACQEVETLMGRKRTVRYGPRTIDLDILFFGHTVLNSSRLVLPHPKLHLRRFVLMPLSEIAPSLNHPVYHQTVANLLTRVSDKHRIRRDTSSHLALLL